MALVDASGRMIASSGPAEPLAALLSDPTDVEECCYRIVDPEWQEVPDDYFPPPTADAVNEYGWKPNHGFLGADNIKEDT